ncbi:hypothetical protein OG271_18185 [Micromonospora rifamycinica]|uniref:hypothetical protein n=2 Tax=Micromonospora TaxID=1873 RepID=UPI002E2C972A|nr:hypothetical protein [Micromonospora rifamycinica]
MQPTNTVAPATTKFQPNSTKGTEDTLISALMIITVVSIGALLWIVLASGPELGSTAMIAIPAIATIAGSAVGGIVLVLRKRPPRSRG